MFENDHSAARGKMAVRELIVFKHSKELGSMLVMRLALGCQLNPFVGTDQQFAVKLIFQNIHTAGDVGLVTSEHFCRVGKAFITGNIIENAVII